MRHLAASLLTALLFHLHPLQAQDDHLLTASLDGFENFYTRYHTDESYSSLRSDSNLLDFNWDFMEWDSRSFNPYKEQDLKEPFFLTFPDDHYASPVGERKVITSHYGWRDGMLHRGIDLDLVTGDDVYAILDGKVRYVRSHAGHGKTVVIRHSNGVETVYAHLSKQLVKEDQIVKKGEVIGKGGTTGNARGSHLHLEVRYQGVTINPEYLFDFENDAIIADASWVTAEIADPRRFSSTKKASFKVVLELAKRVSAGEEEISVPLAVEEVSPIDTTNAEPPLSEVTQSPVLKIIPINYIIQYGDTLYSLARKHHTTVEDICRANGIEDSFKIKVGQKLVLDF
ncbi:MAG: peptidoglycan DD-metalloendopeptidase family protein [Saprospiraceae bacterium]|nr:peptidoglycan DD-metalloendopeptidase family protein [Saprospiraceae bacterium]